MNKDEGSFRHISENSIKNNNEPYVTCNKLFYINIKYYTY